MNMPNKVITTTTLAYYTQERNKVLATKTYVDENGGKIDSISVNGTAQTITNKNVNITVPTKVSELTNDSNYATESYVDTKVSSVYKYKGSVPTYSALPSTGNTTGDVYNVEDTGMNYAWNGTKWDELGSDIDLSNYWDKTNYTLATAQDIDDILNA